MSDARAQCPGCGSYWIEPFRLSLAKRHGRRTLISSGGGLLLMLVCGLIGLINLGGALWVLLTAAPVALFVRETRRPENRRWLDYGHHCTSCGHEWVQRTGEPPIGLQQPAQSTPEVAERLQHVLEHGRAGATRG